MKNVTSGCLLCTFCAVCLLMVTIKLLLHYSPPTSVRTSDLQPHQYKHQFTMVIFLCTVRDYRMQVMHVYIYFVKTVPCLISAIRAVLRLFGP